MPGNSVVVERSEDPVLLAAAEWFDRLQNEELTADDLLVWQRWLSQSPLHQQAFDSVQDLWQRMDRFSAPPLAGESERNADRYTGDMSVARWNQRKPRGEALSQNRKWRVSARSSLALAAMLVVFAVGGALFWQYQLHATVDTVYETGSAHHRQARLPDGSVLSLGARTMVWIRFGAARRDVVLERGEAFFEVAHDTQRPFVVRAGDAQITAVGTAFNVRRSAERVLVAVEEGVVKVGSARAPSSQLSAGHELIVERARIRAPSQIQSAAAPAAWRAGRLEYLNEPLRYVVADVNRYSKAEIVIDDANVGALLVSGTIFEDDIEGWLRSLEQFMPVRVERVGSERISLQSRVNGTEAIR